MDFKETIKPFVTRGSLIIIAPTLFIVTLLFLAVAEVFGGWYSRYIEDWGLHHDD